MPAASLTPATPATPAAGSQASRVQVNGMTYLNKDATAEDRAERDGIRAGLTFDKTENGGVQAAQVNDSQAAVLQRAATHFADHTGQYTGEQATVSWDKGVTPPTGEPVSEQTLHFALKGEFAQLHPGTR
jgi:hypothetical protein